MPILRLAYVTQFLIALMAVFVLWSQVGGQGHLDLMPWYFKLALGAGTAFAVVKATAAAVSHEHPWNGRTLKWLGIMVALLVGCGLATYYCHMYLEGDEGDDQQDSAFVGQVFRGTLWVQRVGNPPVAPVDGGPSGSRAACQPVPHSGRAANSGGDSPQMWRAHTSAAGGLTIRRRLPICPTST